MIHTATSGASHRRPGTVDKLEVGSQSREDVVRLVGSPSAVGTFNPNVWYYITEKQENWGPSRPWISEQNVIQITFNEQGRVANIKYYDLKDAQNITMVSRITPTSGKELTVLEQILGNVGKFSGPRQQSNPARRPAAVPDPPPIRAARQKKKPRSFDRGFLFGTCRPLSARARRAAAGPRCW